MREPDNIYTVKSRKTIEQVRKKGNTVHIRIREEKFNYLNTFTVRLTAGEIVQIGTYVKLRNACS